MRITIFLTMPIVFGHQLLFIYFILIIFKLVKEII